MVFNNGGVCACDGQISQLVCARAEYDIVRLGIKSERNSREDPCRCLGNIVVFSNGHRRRGTRNRDIAQAIGGIIEGDHITRGVEGCGAGRRPANRSVGDGISFGNGYRRALKIKSTDHIRLGQVDLSATLGIVNGIIGIESRGSSTPRPSTGSVTYRFVAAGIFGVERNHLTCRCATNDLQRSKNIA